MSDTESSTSTTTQEAGAGGEPVAAAPMMAFTASATREAGETTRKVVAAHAAATRGLTLPGAAESSDVTDELERGGPALGSFVKSVGLAVAEAQAALDKTLVETADSLSKQKIKVMAVFEQEIDEDGNLQTGKIHEMELPLVNYLMPTAYKWSRVYLEADMTVAEFNAKNGLNIKQSALSVRSDTRGHASFGGASVSSSLGVGYTNTDTAVATSASTDTAAGKLHLEATLEPRTDIELPKPFIVQKGPRLTLTSTGTEDINGTRLGANGAQETVVVGKRASVECLLQKKDGSALSNKQLSVDVDPGGLLEAQPNGFKTDGDGKLSISIARKGAMYKDGTTIDVVVRVSLNYVTQTMSFKL